jgi:hypothetical protein
MDEASSMTYGLMDPHTLNGKAAANGWSTFASGLAWQNCQYERQQFDFITPITWLSRTWKPSVRSGQINKRLIPIPHGLSLLLDNALNQAQGSPRSGLHHHRGLVPRTAIFQMCHMSLTLLPSGQFCDRQHRRSGILRRRRSMKRQPRPSRSDGGHNCKRVFCIASDLQWDVLSSLSRPGPKPGGMSSPGGFVEIDDPIVIGYLCQ